MPKAGRYDYPFFDIDSAIGKLREFYEVVRSDQTIRSVVAEALGMAEKGGGFAYLISSMEKYGLIQTGGGNVTITDLGKTTMYGEPAEVEQAKSKAVTTVDLFRELCEQYGENPQLEQIRAFLRQKANVDVTKAQKIAPKVANIYKKVSNYIISAKKPVEPIVKVPGVGRGKIITPPEVVKVEPLKIQYGDIYIQIPPNDLKAIALAKDALEFMEQRIRKQTKEEKQ